MSTKPKGGGPAFPSPQFAVPQDLREEQVMLLRSLSGMRLRQYYKAKAMQGLLASPTDRIGIADRATLTTQLAAEIADAMLEEDYEHSRRELGLEE